LLDFGHLTEPKSLEIPRFAGAQVSTTRQMVETIANVLAANELEANSGENRAGEVAT
jgi:hypothetical protein